MRKLRVYLSLMFALILSIAAVLVFLDSGLSIAFWLVALVAAGHFYLSREGKCTHFVVWKEKDSVGIASIDEDHKKLFNLINNLQVTVMCDTGREFEREALDQLMDYTRYHFQREEELMRAHGYRDYEAHKGQHDQMIIQTRIFIDRYEEKGRAALPEVVNYLRLWLLQHISVTDKKYTPYFQEKGVI